jgi:hypothetical protein
MNKKRLLISLAAFLMAMILCAGLALAAALTRTINMDWYEPLVASVSPELAQPLSAPYGGSNSLTYTVTNPTPTDYTVTCSNGTVPTGVVVTFLPLSFPLATGTSQDVLVTVSNPSGTPPDSDIALYFTPST